MADIENRIAELNAEIARLREELRKANTPLWFYALDCEDMCAFSVQEAIEWHDLDPGDHVVRISTARPCPDLWCAVRVTSDPDADQRHTFTEHATEQAARAALAKAKAEGRADG